MTISLSLPPSLSLSLTLAPSLSVANGDVLKDNLKEELDYALLPRPAWDKLSKWYGLSDGSRPIIR